MIDDFQGLDVQVSYTTTVVIKNTASEDLKNWYEKVFSRQNPILANAFEFEDFILDTNIPAIAIIGNDPGFMIQTMIYMFQAFKHNQRVNLDEPLSAVSA